ncbi:DUF4179 domain-containing protein [Paenibacillus zanthoxyli]|nr:DUF4179 domain-containing protein [Paenibacillus zanthoxyli]
MVGNTVDDDQNLVKPVRQRAENKGYRVDVAGAVTDSRMYSKN